MNKKQPVPCGCRGEAVTDYIIGEPHEGLSWFVYCKNCEIQLPPEYSTEDEAIDAWNRAMGNAEKSSTVERTAKVKDIVHTHGYPDEGLCGNCNEDVNGLYDYCPYCGARLEWDE